MIVVKAATSKSTSTPRRRVALGAQAIPSSVVVIDAVDKQYVTIMGVNDCPSGVAARSDIRQHNSSHTRGTERKDSGGVPCCRHWRFTTAGRLTILLKLCVDVGQVVELHACP